METLFRCAVAFGKTCEFVPMGSVAALIVSFVYRERGNRQLAEFFLWVAMVSVAGSLAVAGVLSGIAYMRPIRFDLYANRIEGLMGYPSNHMAEFIGAHTWIKLFAYLDYELYGITLLAAIWIQAIRNGVERGREVLYRFIALGACAVPIYWVCPLSGPDYAFPNFPAIYTGPVHVIQGTSFPDCVPSVHFAMALLVLWYLREWKWGIVFGSLHLALTTVATLGFGQHYAIDLIAAVPFTWAVMRAPGLLRLVPHCASNNWITCEANRKVIAAAPGMFSSRTKRDETI